MTLEFTERIARIPTYPAAGGYAQQEPLVRLASNESPYPPLPAVREAIEHALTTLNRYPDPTNSILRTHLSDRYGVPAARIAIGNGSCDILLAAGEALLEPGAELVYSWPSFSVYPHLGAASGARAITVPLDAEECHDLEAMLREITVATRLAIVCNPNNPTSTALHLADIATFVAEVPPHVCVIIDEAYCEFNLLDDPDASVELLDRHPRGRPGPPAVLLQRARAGRRRGGARPPGCGHRARDTHDRRASLGRRATARIGTRSGPLAD
jgi:histidinol-phosphate aminotransferase